MRQAIITKYLAPTNFRGSRVKATCNAGTLTMPWDYELVDFQNQERVAMALAEKLGWHKYNDFTGGVLPKDKGMVWVAIEKLDKPRARI